MKKDQGEMYILHLSRVSPLILVTLRAQEHSPTLRENMKKMPNVFQIIERIA